MASSRWSAPAPETMPIVRTGSGPSAKASGSRRPGPEEGVVDEDEVGPFLARACEELGVGADARHDRLDLLASGYLQSVGPVVVVCVGSQKLVQVANDLVAGCCGHRHRYSC